MVVQFLSRARLKPTALIGAVGLLAVSLTTGSALGGFSAKISNPANSVGSGTVGLSVADSTGCASASAAPGVTLNCTGNLFPATVPASGSASRTSGFTRTGTVDPTSASLQVISCGLSQLADIGSSAAPLLPRWATSYAVAGPLIGGAALGLDGSTSYAESTAGEDGTAAGLQTFTLGIWFKSSVATTGSGRGSLIAFEDTPIGTAASASDRILAMDAQGHLVFSVQTSTRVSVSTTNTYLDGSWHLAVATANPASNTITVSVDAQQVSTTNSQFTTSAGTNPGYFKIGLSSAGTGVGVPGYWPGQLSDAFVLPTALNSTQVSALFAARSQAAFASAVAGYSPTHFWPLNDDGSTVYTGTVPGLTGGTPCAQVGARAILTSSGTTYCLIPTTSCTTTWATIAPGTTTIPGATASAKQSLLLSVQRAATGFDATNMPGLHILVPVSVAESRAAFSATLNWQHNELVVQ